MANVIKLRKGLDINLKGKAAEEFMSVKEPGFYSLVPDDFTGITPKVVVKEQEYVMAGGPLFIDKNHPDSSAALHRKVPHGNASLKIHPGSASHRSLQHFCGSDSK